MTEVTIFLKREKGELDLPAWERLLESLERLGKDGMSSEEEGEYEEELGQVTPIFWVKLCAWRADQLNDGMRWIDNQAKLLRKQRRGAQAMPRKPSKTGAVGNAEPPKGLPSCMYKSEWLANQPYGYVQRLQISQEAFALFQAATSRMG